MNRFKKAYCAASFVFACVSILLTIYLSLTGPAVTYAAQPGDETGQTAPEGDDISDLTGDGDTEEDDGTAPTGMSILWNNDEGNVSTPVRMLIVLTILSLAPSILIMMTSFVRIIIVLHFIRTAIGTQTAPPNQVLVGLALFLTFFIMWPTFQTINTEAIVPLDKGEITQEEFFKRVEEPIRTFMIEDAKVQVTDVNLFAEISGATYESPEELYSNVPFTTLVPAFILSELRKAFIMGFLIYIPFIVIDMVVASVLMSMGMMMLPPTTISLPFKLLLFILADGWNLVLGQLVSTFY